MRIDDHGPGNAATNGSHHSATAVAAVAAQAAREAARLDTDPMHRSAAGWALAEGAPSGSKASVAGTIADAGGNARTAMTRTDLPPGERAQVRTVVERLGNALVDGRIAPHVNDAFRADLRKLATLPADNGDFRGALAQMNRAAEVLDRVELASGTRLAYDPGANQSGVKAAGLPILNVADIDADLYFKTADGTLHVESAKSSPDTLASEVDESIRGTPDSKPTQIDRQVQWERAGTAVAPREFGMATHHDSPGFNHLLDDKRLAQFEKLVGGDADARRFVLGERAFSLNELKQIDRAAGAAGKAHVQEQLRQHVESGQPKKTFDVPKAYEDFYTRNVGGAEGAVRRYAPGLGEPLPPLRRLAPLAPADIAQGAKFGGLAAGALTLIDVARDGRLTFADAATVVKHSAEGAGIGALAAAGERAAMPLVDRVIGTTVQRAATAVAPRIASSVGTLAPRAAGLASAESAAAFGAGARTLASRVGGATVVGAAIATGISAWENRDGLAKGDSKAIGNVAADTAVAAGSIAAATAAGAAIGSVVPVAGTAVGAVVGLAVGVGVAYGAQISGARDWVADKAAGAIDAIKGWF
jgi:hypothetical protein